MASVGHIAVGMAAARAYDPRRAPRWTAMAAWSALAMLPDLDVIGFALGVHYGDPWGHRGAAHSLLMAAALGIALKRHRTPAQPAARPYRAVRGDGAREPRASRHDDGRWTGLRAALAV